MNIFLIAEIGINHNGNLNIAKKLIDSASEAGFDAVKFQKRTIEKVFSKDFLNSFRESPWGNTQRDQKKGLEFNKNEYQEIDKYCKEKNVEWSASAWNLESQEFIVNFNVKRSAASFSQNWDCCPPREPYGWYSFSCEIGSDQQPTYL